MLSKVSLVYEEKEKKDNMSLYRPKAVTPVLYKLVMKIMIREIANVYYKTHLEQGKG